MKIKKLDIVSFGKWDRKSIVLEDGLNIICGPNESGKTSMRMFVTYVLFGLNKNERERYTSKQTGQLGGRVFLEIDGEEWTLERFEHRHRGQVIAYVNGERISDDQLKSLLKGVNRSLFDSIFSFQARDLYAIRNKTSEEVGQILFNLGLTGSDQIVTLENKLEKDAGDLFKKTGTKPTINVKLEELKDLVKQIDQVRAEEANHQNLQQSLTELETQIEQYRDDKTSLESTQKRVDKILQVKHALIQHQGLTDKLKQADLVEEFPAGAKERYDKYKREETEYKGKHSILQSRIEKTKEQIATLEQATKHEGFPISLNEASSLVDSAKEVQREIEKLKEQLNEDQIHLNSSLEEIGLEASIDELLDLKINMFTENTWRDIATTQNELKNELDKIRLKTEKKQDELSELEQKQEQLNTKLLDTEKRAALEQERDALKVQKEQGQWREQQKQDDQKRSKHYEQEARKYNRIKVAIPLTAILFAVLYSFFNSFQIDWIVIGFVALIGIAGFLFGQSQAKNYLELSQESNKSMAGTGQTFNQDRLNELEQLLSADDSARENYKDLAREAKLIQSQLKDFESELRHVQLNLEKNESAREAQQTQFPFLKQEDVKDWPSFYQSLSKAKDLAEQVKKTTNALNQLAENLNEEEKIAKEILGVYGEEGALNIWDRLSQKLDEENNTLRNISDLEKHLQEAEKDLDQLNAMFKPYEEEWKELLAQAEAESEEDFLSKRDAHVEYVSLQSQLEQARDTIYQTFYEQTDELLNQTFDWDELQKNYEESKERLGLIEESLSELIDERAKVKASLNHLEEAGQLSDLVHKKSLLVDEIKQLSKQWAVYRMAFGYLKQTKDRYQNVYFPDIIKGTTENFAHLTNHKYNEVQFSDETINVQDRDGEWYTIGQLSEGTADQLYIALRLSLSQALQSASHFPFLLDDAFVNFDETRQQNMFELLKHRANTQQIIYFTCKVINDLEDDQSIRLINLAEEKQDQLVETAE